MPLIQHNIQDSPTFAAQAVDDSVDDYASSVVGSATGVISGCLVSPGGGMTVNVASGVVWSNGVAYIVPSTNLPVTAHSTGDRRDTVCYTPGIGLQVVPGVDCGTNGWVRTSPGDPPVKAMGPASGSTANQVPYGSVILAEAYVSASTGTVAAGNLIDKTTVLNPSPLPPLGSAVMVTMSWGTNTATANGTHDNVIERIAGRCGIQSFINLCVGGSLMASHSSLEGPYGGYGGVLHLMVPPSSTNLAQGIYNSVQQGVQGAVSGPPLFVLHAINDLGAGAPLASVSTAVTTKWQTLLNNAFGNALTAAISRHAASLVMGSYSTGTGTLTTHAAGLSAYGWDATILFAQGSGGTSWSNVNNFAVNFPANTGPVFKATTLGNGTTQTQNGNTFTIQVPNNYPGGTATICLLACPTGLAGLSANITNASPGNGGTFTSLAQPAGSVLQSFQTSGQQVVQIDSEQILCSTVAVNTGTGVYTFTVATGGRGYNSTAAASHVQGAAIFTPQTGLVSWSGTASCVAGMSNTPVTGQGTPLQAAGLFIQQNNVGGVIPVRVTLQPSDAGTTIIGTVSGMLAGDAVSRCMFDSWWLESPYPSPAVIANMPRFPCGIGTSQYTYMTAAEIVSLNAQMATTVSQFGAWCQIADLDAAWNARNATISGAVNKGTFGIVIGTGSAQNCNVATLAASNTSGTSGAGTITFYDTLSYYNAVSFQTVTSNASFNTCTGGRVSAGDTTAAQVANGASAVLAKSISLTLNNAANPPVVGQRWVMGTACPYYFTTSTSLVASGSTGVNLAVSAGAPPMPVNQNVIISDGQGTTITVPVSVIYSGGGTIIVTSTAIPAGWNPGGLPATGPWTCSVASQPEDMILLSQTSLVGTAFTGVFGRAYNGTTNQFHFGGDVAAPADWFFTDNVHPSALGAAKIADVVYASFQAACFNSLSLALSAGSATPVQNNKAASGTRFLDQGWWIPPMADGTALPATGGATIYAYPFDVEGPGIIEVTGCSMMMTVTGVTQQSRIGIYFPDNSGARPGTLVYDFGAIATNAGEIAPQWIVGCGKLIYPGRYFVAVVPNQLVGGTGATFRTVGNNSSITTVPQPNYPTMSSKTIANNAPTGGAGVGPVYAVTGTGGTGSPFTGALPTAFPGSLSNNTGTMADVTTANIVPVVCLQFRSHQWN